jgi:hypothetical protein
MICRRPSVEYVEELIDGVDRGAALELAHEDLPRRDVIAVPRPALADFGRPLEPRGFGQTIPNTLGGDARDGNLEQMRPKKPGNSTAGYLSKSSPALPDRKPAPR